MCVLASNEIVVHLIFGGAGWLGFFSASTSCHVLLLRMKILMFSKMPLSLEQMAGWCFVTRRNIWIETAEGATDFLATNSKPEFTNHQTQEKSEDKIGIKSNSPRQTLILIVV